MTLLKQNLLKILDKVLGEALSASLSETELNSLLSSFEIITPQAGKCFWQTGASPPGFYIVLEGRVRLLDRADDLVVSLSSGESFGELSLFPPGNFQPYSIRASHNVQIGYLNVPYLQRLAQPHPAIVTQLHAQAIARDLHILLKQKNVGDALRNIPRENIPRLLSLLESTHLVPGSPLPPHLFHQHLWLLRQGELQHSSGVRLMSAQAISLSEAPGRGTWQVIRPTELYSLSQADYENLKSDLTQRPVPRSTPNDLLTVKLPLPSPSAPLLKVTSPTSPADKPQPLKPYFPQPSVTIGHWWQRWSRRYPFLKQQSAADCGVACLVMVGLYWGKRLGISQLRNIANVDRSGTSLRGLINAAEAIGFSARPVKADLPGLTQQKLPAIAHWKGKHYIVVYRVTRRQVVVSDPAIGRLELNHRDFLAGWTGYTLLIQPTVLFQETPEAKQDLWRFFEVIKPHWFVLLEVFLASVMIQVFGLCTPILTQLILDQVVVQRSVPTFTAVGVGLVMFSVFPVLMNSLRRYLLYHTTNRIDLSLVAGFISHTFRLPLMYFDTRFVGDITSRVQENAKIRNFLSGDALTTLLDLLTVVVYIGLMFWYSWPLALMSLVFIPALLLLTLITTPFLRRISRAVFSAKTAEGSYLIESLTGIGTIKAMGIERTVRWHWEDLFNQSIKTSFSGQMFREQVRLVSSLVEVSGTMGIFLFGVWQVIQGQLSLGQLIAFNMLLSNVIGPFKRLGLLWNDFQEVLISLERISDVIDAPSEEAGQSHLPSLPAIQGHLRFEGVTFRYSSESDINTLENLSFEIFPGKMVAIVGRSGSGKTTLAKLVLGLYPPTEGKIFIDGYDLNSIAKRSLRQQVGVVDQNTFLFGGTIRENITIAHPEASAKEMIEAAELAGAHQFIQDLPLKYETQIGESGNLLSGGQRQRLAIARALLGHPRLLIMDEATSNLDAESERIIQTNLNQMLKDRTTLVIAHRLSTVRHADLILVLDRGILVESGTHDQLIAKRGQYFYLNQQQLEISH